MFSLTNTPKQTKAFTDFPKSSRFAVNQYKTSLASYLLYDSELIKYIENYLMKELY